MDFGIWYKVGKKIFFFRFLKRFYLLIFRERGREGGRETLMSGCLSHAPDWELAYNPGMCPNWELNQWSLGSQAGTQSTEPHQPGQEESVPPGYSVDPASFIEKIVLPPLRCSHKPGDLVYVGLV